MEGNNTIVNDVNTIIDNINNATFGGTSSNCLKYNKSFIKKYKVAYDPDIKVEDTCLELSNIGISRKIIYIAYSHIRDNAIMLYNAITYIYASRIIPNRDESTYYVYCDSFELRMQGDDVVAYIYYPNTEKKEFAIFTRAYRLEEILIILYEGICNYFRQTYSIRFSRQFVIEELSKGSAFEYIEYTLKRWAGVLKNLYEYSRYRIEFPEENISYFKDIKVDTLLDFNNNEPASISNRLELFELNTLDRLFYDLKQS